MRFIRHVDRRKNLPGDSKVAAGAFLCREEQGETEVSLTLQSDELQTETQLDAYQQASKIQPSGDLPGLVFITHDQLVATGLTPKLAREEGRAYGHLHYVIEAPTPEQAAELAFLATENGVIRGLVRRKKGPVAT